MHPPGDTTASKNYPQAKLHGRNALILTILNIIFTMFLSLLIIGLVTMAIAVLTTDLVGPDTTIQAVSGL